MIEREGTVFRPGLGDKALFLRGLRLSFLAGDLKDALASLKLTDALSEVALEGEVVDDVFLIGESDALSEYLFVAPPSLLAVLTGGTGSSDMSAVNSGKYCFAGDAVLFRLLGDKGFFEEGSSKNVLFNPWRFSFVSLLLLLNRFLMFSCKVSKSSSISVSGTALI